MGAASWHPLTRLAVGGIALALATLFALYDLAVARLMFADLHMNDFGKFYYSARQFLDGQDMYAPNVATLMPVGGGRVHQFLNMNPPHFHLLLLPIARLSPGAAALTWTAASVVALGWSLRLILRELRLPVTPLAAAWWLAALLAWAATGTLIVTGQVSLLLMLGVTLSWVHARRGEWTASGAWLGVLASVKPFLLIFVPWLIARRRWWAVASLAAGSAAAFLIGVAVFGLEAHRSWLQALGTTNWEWAAMNASLLGAISRWFGESPYFTPVASAPWIVRPLWLASAAAVAATSLILASRARGVAGVDYAFALLLVGALLVSPLGWVYYWWLPFGPVVAVLFKRRPSFFWLVAPLLLVPLGLVVGGEPDGWKTLTVGSAYFWGTLLVWASIGVPASVRSPTIRDTRQTIS